MGTKRVIRISHTSYRILLANSNKRAVNITRAIQVNSTIGLYHPIVSTSPSNECVLCIQ